MSGNDNLAEIARIFACLREGVFRSAARELELPDGSHGLDAGCGAGYQTMMLAEEINRTDTGIWGRIRFDPDELGELRIAAWMHDVGKITTPEHVVDKATKLETIYDRLETVRIRYEVLKRDAEIEALRKKVDLLSGGNGDPDEFAELDHTLLDNLGVLREEMEFVERCNSGGEFMADEDIARLEEIACRTYTTDGGEAAGLTGDEVTNLSIRKGTLTEEERHIISNHADVTIRMLSRLPFSRKMRRVPEYAGGHHEKLNAKGYPRGLRADQLPLQARIMAVADIFEALTASDRPYRKPMPLSQALKIIGFMVKDGELDGRIVDLFVGSGLAAQYAGKELDPSQVDIGET